MGLRTALSASFSWLGRWQLVLKHWVRLQDSRHRYWRFQYDVKAEFKAGFILLIAEYDYPPVGRDEVYKEIYEQADSFKKITGWKPYYKNTTYGVLSVCEEDMAVQWS